MILQGIMCSQNVIHGVLRQYELGGDTDRETPGQAKHYSVYCRSAAKHGVHSSVTLYYLSLYTDTEWNIIQFDWISSLTYRGCMKGKL